MPGINLSHAILGVLLIAGCGKAETGDACATADDCDDERCITGGSFPGGTCTPACATNADCPQGFSCISRSSGMCLRDCTATQACQDERGAAWQCRLESLQEGGGNQMVCIGA
ncbi:MAG: hypothetical protein IPH44_02640 [Myxococcales bacterium]|jgi:hypothetical protein|nr:hypothetical protein [Myxococcales bacterium]MBK7198217.1 hypothetical protein [Myxococcales bacterium]MBP6849068.1 hypothetical protein [Kofleriaceae bacterium]